MSEERLFKKIRNRIYGNYPDKGKDYAHGVAMEVMQLIRWHDQEKKPQVIKPVPPSKVPGTPVRNWSKKSLNRLYRGQL